MKQINKSCRDCNGRFVAANNGRLLCDECRAANGRRARREWMARQRLSMKSASADVLESYKTRIFASLERNKERIRARHSAYRKTERGRKARNEWRRKRYAENHEYRLSVQIRTRIRDSLRVSLVKKPRRSMSLVGMEGPDLMKYLLSLVGQGSGFTAENYCSVWVVDHIRPIASFDLNNPEQVAAAMHYTNLQPMEKTENLRKGSRYDGTRHYYRQASH